MNERNHWNRIGSGYDDEIFDVFRSDRNKLLPTYFLRHADPKGKAIDFGCGTGKAFPYLSVAFGKVTGYDISEELLKVADSRQFTNVRVHQADLTRKNLRFDAADFLFCCNVIMLPEMEMNMAMFRNVHKALKKGGHAVLIVPSLESMFYTAFRLIDWNRREGTKASAIPASDMAYFSAPKHQLAEGIIHIDKVPTKHYLEPELRVLLKEAGLTVTSTERAEYEWTSEFAEPPKWMKEPYPWDWLVECRRG